MSEPQRRPVIGYESVYDVDDAGAVFRVRSGRALVPYLRKNGYLQVQLNKDGAAETRLVHTLVAEAFLGPRPAGQQINHIDHDKTNNAASNLEYVTPKENAHAFQRHLDPGWTPQLERGRAVRPVVAEHEVTRHVVRFASIREAVEMGFTDAGISMALTGRLKTHRGYTFKDA